MVERFNGRISEMLVTHRFESGQNLAQTLEQREQSRLATRCHPLFAPESRSGGASTGWSALLRFVKCTGWSGAESRPPACAAPRKTGRMVDAGPGRRPPVKQAFFMPWPKSTPSAPRRYGPA